jgi:TPR repeat protein
MTRSLCNFLCSWALLLGTLAWAQEPKNHESPASTYDLGLSYLKGTDRNELEAIKYIRVAADQGYAPAQFAIGYFHETGQLGLSDPHQAITWYKKAANQGDIFAQFSLGRMYFTGSDVGRDLAEAEKWLRKAANAGEPLSQFYLGKIREEKDYSFIDATEWYRKAAEQGLGQAQQKLAFMLDQGRGVPRKPAEAYLWYVIASDFHRPVSIEIGRLQGEIGTSAATEARQKAVSMERDIVARRNGLGCYDWPGREFDLPTSPDPTLQQNCKR